MLEQKPAQPLRPPIQKPKSTEQPPKSWEISVFEEVKSRLSPLEVKAFETLVPRYLKTRPRIEEFNYPDKEQDQIRLTVKQREIRQHPTTEIEKIHYAQSKIFEALLGEIIELHWLPDSYLTETSEFDDLLNGIDAVLESSTRAAVIDFTSQHNKEVIKKKLTVIFDKIKRNQLSEAKYFRSQQDNNMHHLKMLPAVIVGLEARTLQELLELRMAGKKKELANHWSRYALVEELLAQIKSFRRYINNRFREGYDPQKADEMDRAYQELEVTIMGLKQKISQGEKMDQLIRQQLPGKDLVYSNIVSAVTV